MGTHILIMPIATTTIGLHGDWPVAAHVHLVDTEWVTCVYVCMPLCYPLTSCPTQAVIIMHNNTNECIITCIAVVYVHTHTCVTTTDYLTYLDSLWYDRRYTRPSMTTTLFLSLLFCGSFLVAVHAATGKHCDSSVDLRAVLVVRTLAWPKPFFRCSRKRWLDLATRDMGVRCRSGVPRCTHPLAVSQS